MKKYIAILCCLFSLSVYSQSVEDNPEVRNWLNTMFQHLDKSKVPYGYLRDYAFELADLDIYNGKELNDSNYVNRTAFENLLRTVRSASVGTAPFDVNEVLAAQYTLGENNKGIMGIVAYKYSYIKENALSENLIRYENEQVYDNIVNGVWQNPYATGYTLGFSAQDTTLYGNTIIYSFPSNIWKSNIIFQNVEFDADNGSGYFTVSKGSDYSINYPSGGVKHLKLRVRLSDGSFLYSHSLIKIISSEKITRAREGEIIADKIIDVTDAESYNGVKAEGRISILYSLNNPGKITKPFIVMEGFDPVEFAPRGEKLYCNDAKYGNTNINTLCSTLDDYVFTYNQLRNEYDIIYVDLFDSKLSIQANARLLERVIEIINEYKKQSGSNEKNVILGQSMGGLIARYALKEMENQNKIHDVSLLACQDTPHLGAHVPLGVLQGINGLLQFYYEKKFFGVLDLGDIKSKLAPILYSDAAKQMLINYVGVNGTLDNSYHEAWQKELRQMGYPQGDNGYKMRIVSISNGQTSVVDENDPYIYVDGKASTTVITDMLTEFILPIWGLALDVVFDDWQTFVLGLLPGSSTFTVHFEANPPSYKSSICNMYLRYTKKFLWIAKIRRTIYSYQRTWPSGMVHYDVMPGSFYKLSDLNGEHYDESQAPKWVRFFAKYNLNTAFGDKIMFIPTVSALDIGEGKVELTTADYEKKYLMDFPPARPKHTPFDAFYITNGSSRHIFFEESMFDWLMEQMKVMIDGPDIATDGAQYVIRNNTKNYVTTWSSSDDSIATMDNSGQLTMKKHGVITITATCVTEDNITYKFYKKVMVGFPPVVLDYHLDKEVVVTPRFVNAEDEAFREFLQFEWNIKVESGKLQEWRRGEEWRVPTFEDRVYKVTVYMRSVNAEGLTSNTIYLPIDGTAPYCFEYGNPKKIHEVSYPNMGGVLRIDPNFLRSDVDSIPYNEELQIVKMVSTPDRVAANRNIVYFDSPLVSGYLNLNDFWRELGYFNRWVYYCYTGHSSSYSSVVELLFYNKYNRIIQRKILQIRYVRR